MNRRTLISERDGTDLPSNVVPFPPAADRETLGTFRPLGDLFAAVVMNCRGKITVIEAQPPVAREEDDTGGCFD